MLSMESNVDSQKLRTGTLTDADWDAVVEGIGTIGSSKLVIDDTPGISIMNFVPNAGRLSWNMVSTSL